MAFKSTFKSWINVILVLIIILSTSVVAIKNCRRIQEQEQDLEYSKGAVIRWEQCLFRVKYPKNLTVGSKAEFGCKYGFYLLGAKYAKCGASEKWIVTEKRLECHRIKCRKPDFNITHGNISQSVENISPEYQGYIKDSIIWVECDSGYKPKDSAVRVCLYNDIDHDDNTVFTGIWSQRDEDGHILEGGDSKLECVQDINVIEQNLLVFILSCAALSCAALVGFVVSILLIIRLKINKTKQTGDAAEMERLLRNEEQQSQNAETLRTRTDELERRLNTLQSEKEGAEKKLKQLHDWKSLKEITGGRCSECMNNIRVSYNSLEMDRQRLVNIILKIQNLIADITNFDSFILLNKETDTGAQLLKLIGKLGGLVEGCDKSRSVFVTDEDESEIQDTLLEVRNSGKRLGIPCLNCVQVERDCKQKEYQITRLQNIIDIIKSQLVRKIQTFSQEVSLFKPEAGKEVAGLNKIVGKIEAHLEDCDDNHDSYSTTGYVRTYDNTVNPQSSGESGGAQVADTSNDTQRGLAPSTDINMNTECENQSYSNIDNGPSLELRAEASSTTSCYQNKECRNRDNPNNAASGNGNLDTRDASTDGVDQQPADRESKNGSDTGSREGKDRISLYTNKSKEPHNVKPDSTIK